MHWTAALEGFALGGGLIIAIGAQNAFVLRQGLLRAHVAPVVAMGALADALLILAGALGFGALVRQSETALTLVFFGGAAMLLAYAFFALRRALSPGDALQAAAADAERPLLPTLGMMAAFTFLNPHVYLDTVVLLGGVSAQYALEPRIWFTAGAMVASLVWFTALGFGARLLAPVFRRPSAWRALDALICLVMATLGLGLLSEALARV